MDNLIEKISQKLKTLRSDRSWSLDVTSQKTGVSKAMLGQIERGESSPTIATLWKIASGFDVPFSFFVDDAKSSKSDQIYRNQELPLLHKDDGKIIIQPIFSYEEDLAFEVFKVELLPGCEHLSPPHQQDVVEHIIVISGEIEILADGQWQSVKESEGFRFNANKPHGYRNRASCIATFHNIIHYKKLR